MDGQGNLERSWKVREESGNWKINSYGSPQKNFSLPEPSSNDFSSETTGPIVTEFHIQPPGPLGKKNVQMV